MWKKAGNKGFSLVELLIGVTILAVIIVPLASAFIVSAKTSATAKETHSQTIAAQSVIESYKATDITTLIQRLAAGYDALGSVATITRLDKLVIDQDGSQHYDTVPSSDYSSLAQEDPGPGYRLYLTGIAGTTKNYDAILYLDASAFAQNTTPVVDYRSMDAVYPQPDPTIDPDADPDIMAAKDIASQVQIDSGTAVPYTTFQDLMARTITVTIQKLPSDAQSGVISCKVQYHYKARYTYTVTDRSQDPPQEVEHTNDYYYDYPYILPNVSYAPGQKGLSGLYLFFYPNSIAQSDAIDIYNLDNVACSVYLARQSDNDTGYNPVITLYETAPGWEPLAVLHYNYQSDSSYNYTYSTLINGWPYYDPSKTIDNNILVDTKQKNRVYNVKAELYTAGANYSAGAKQASFDASSFNK